MHFILPFVALILYGLEPRKALPIALLGIVPDLDVLLSVHKSFTHSLPVIILAAAPFLYYYWRTGSKRLGTVWLCFLSLASNPVLDMFCGFTPILWPLHPYSLWLEGDLIVRFGSEFTLKPSISLNQIPTVFTKGKTFEGSLFTNESLLATLVLMAPILYKQFKTRYLA
jgi:membrane-bound metal-dependent hydrolase YbcI (DUF457 family)